MALLLGVAAIGSGTPGLAETRRALEAEARANGAPMVWVADGAFTMGSQDGASKGKPVHQVYLNAFYMDMYEVTTARYAKFLEAAGPDQPKLVPMFWEQVALRQDGDRPVIGVTWSAAESYCRWAGKRLPSEAEWEKAARGTDGRTYPWGNEEPAFKRANFDKPFPGSIYRDGLKPVGSYEAGKSPYGIYDMAGNASEWVSDWYDEKYYVVGPESNPTGPPNGRQKVLRGGSMVDPTILLSAASRESYFPADTGPFVGIRCAQDAF